MKNRKYIFIILTCIMTFLLALTTIVGYGNIYLIFLINVAMFIYLFKMQYNWKLILIIFLQWLIYLIFLIIHVYFIKLPGSGSDDLRFEQLGLNYYYHMAFGTSVNLFQDSTTYPKIIGLFYLLGIPNKIIPGLINITVHTVTTILLYKINLYLFKNEKIALISSFLYTIYPLTMLSTVITLREVFIILFILLFTLNLLKYHETKNIINIFFAIISILLGSLFHIGVIGLVLCLIGYYLIYTQSPLLLKVILTLLMIVGFISFILNSNNSKIESKIDKNEQVQQLDDTTSRADYISKNQSNSILVNLEQEIYFIIKPLPWEIRTGSDIVGFGNIVFIIFSIYCAIKIYNNSYNEKIIIIMLTVLSLYLTFALGTYNYGTALRHRDKSSMLLIIFIVYYFSIYKKEIHKI